MSSEAIAIYTNPTGFSSVPPSGPEMPVVATVISAFKRFFIPFSYPCTDYTEALRLLGIKAFLLKVVSPSGASIPKHILLVKTCGHPTPRTTSNIKNKVVRM